MVEHAFSIARRLGNRLEIDECDHRWCARSIRLFEITTVFPTSVQVALAHYHGLKSAWVLYIRESESIIGSEDSAIGTQKQLLRCVVRNRSIPKDESKMRSRGKAKEKIKNVKLEKKYSILWKENSCVL